jgi:hypothetical protein
MLRLLAFGSRTWFDGALIHGHLLEIYNAALRRDGWTRPVLIHGAAKGADSLAAAAGAAIGYDVIAFPADWKKHGNGAGPIRNQQMLDEGHPTAGLGFGALRRPDGWWTGTGDMACRLVEAGVRVTLIGKPTAARVAPTLPRLGL